MDVQEWIAEALHLGFTAAAPLEPSALRFRADVRAACVLFDRKISANP